MRGLAAALLILTTVVAPAAAQDAFCADCQARRWQALETQLLKRAATLKDARQAVRDAERSGSAELLADARAALASATAAWRAVDDVARKLESRTYTTYLARAQVDVEQRYDEARAALHRKTEQFDRLRGVLGDQKARALGEMDGIIRQEAKERRELGLNGALIALKGAAVKAEAAIEELRKLPAGQARDAALRDLQQFVGLVNTAEGARIRDELARGEHWAAVAGGGQLILGLAIPRVLPPATAASATAHATAWPAFLTLALDLTQIGLSHVEFHEAQERLDGVRNVELAWQSDIRALGARVGSLRAEREFAAEAIRRQQSFAQQVSRIRAEVGR
jgi:hypothetical protein